MSLYKFTHIPLFKNDVQLKQKMTKKKINHPNLLKNKKHVKKKKITSIKKNKKNKSLLPPRTRKLKEKTRTRQSIPGKRANICPRPKKS